MAKKKALRPLTEHIQFVVFSPSGYPQTVAFQKKRAIREWVAIVVGERLSGEEVRNHWASMKKNGYRVAKCRIVPVEA